MKKNIGLYATVLALMTMVISGFNNFLTKIAVTAIKDPIAYTTLKNALVALVFIGAIILFKKWSEILVLTKKQILKLFAIGIIGGAIPFALYFTGLTQTNAVNASLIHKTLFLWVAILALATLKERITSLQWLGIGAIFMANILVGGFTGFKFNSGELMILAATILWAIETVIAKKLLADVSSMLVGASRMIIGSLVLFIIVLFQGHASLLTGLDAIQWGWTLLTSVLLAGYVLTWFTALKYAPATYVTTLLVPATLITNMLSALFITHAFSVKQFISSALFVIGLILVIRFTKKTSVVAKPSRIGTDIPS